MRGEVVGINSLIYSRTGGYMGLAFADPDRRSDERRSNAADAEKGRVTRGRIRRADPAGHQGRRRKRFGLGISAAGCARQQASERDGLTPPRPGVGEWADIIIKADGRG